MKIDRKNPKHWMVLAVTGINTVFAILYRNISGKREQKRVLFYGHKFNGNLRSFYEHLAKNHPDFEPYFLTMDSNYSKNLPSGVKVLKTTSLMDMMKVARASVMFTSHGSHALVFLNKYSDMNFVDVWHGVSFKGWGKSSFGEQKDYEEIWVTSKFIKDVYVRRFGFKREKVRVTGYGRTDQLINGSLDKAKIISKYKIPKAKKYILIAPTWKQDVSGRNVLPFDTPEDAFFRELDDTARKHDAHVIFRTHLNSNEDINVSHLTNTSFMPYSKYEVVEDFLFIADILVTDWSSVGIDYLPLKRPAIFLDVPAPFKHGFELGPEHRYGDVVGNFEELNKSLEKYLKSPEKFLKLHTKDIARTIAAAYGSSLDGKSLERYYENLANLIDEKLILQPLPLDPAEELAPHS